MIVLAVPEQRERRHDYWLGGTTATVAGLVNVCSVIAFFAFASNVTGHVAVLTEELVKGHWHQLGVVLSWLLAFLVGAFVANMIVSTIGRDNPRLGRAIGIGLVMSTLTAVGYYGQFHYAETLTETEYLVAILLLAMGVQNGLVATVSSGVVKTTHLTGLFTDLGIELSLLIQSRFRPDADLDFKLRLHLFILLSYIVGGVLGGMLFLSIGFATFHVGSAVFGLILTLDVLAARSPEAITDLGAGRDSRAPSFAPALVARASGPSSQPGRPATTHAEARRERVEATEARG